MLPTPKHKRKLDSVGPAAAGVEVRIWSREEERWLAAATALPHEVSAPVVEGEVCVRGDCAILQYDDTLPAHVDANRNAWLIDPDGGLSWLRTGDKGWLDEDAHLHLTGRFKEMINRAGESVPPALVEAAVLEHPAIASCSRAAWLSPKKLPLSLQRFERSASGVVLSKLCGSRKCLFGWRIYRQERQERCSGSISLVY